MAKPSEMGRPRVQSLRLTNVAQIMRASLFTFDVWLHVIEMLFDCAPLSLPLVQVTAHRSWTDGVSHQQLWPRWWQSPAFACTLRQASKGFPQVPRLQNQGPRALLRLKRIQRATPHLFHHALHPQRHLSQALHSLIFPDALQDLFIRRLSRWFPNSLPVIALIPWSEVRSNLLLLPHSRRSNIIKTFVGGWITVGGGSGT